VAALATLFLAVRVLLHLLEVAPNPSLLGQAADLSYRVTDPFVLPLTELVPWTMLLGRPLDLPAVVVMLMVYLVASLLIHDLTSTHSNHQCKRPRR